MNLMKMRLIMNNNNNIVRWVVQEKKGKKAFLFFDDNDPYFYPSYEGCTLKNATLFSTKNETKEMMKRAYISTVDYDIVKVKVEVALV
jgi:hypothetical protein